jgi:hypothetical protein
MNDWRVTELEFGTLWCEFEREGVAIWLEWNPRVFAYRYGYTKNNVSSRSRLGFADSLEAARQMAIEDAFGQND